MDHERYRFLQDEVLNRIVTTLQKNKNVVAVILRGSMRRGRISKHSDLDIRVVSRNGEDETERKYFDNEIPIHLIAYSIEFIRREIKKNNLLIIDLIKNDRILYEEDNIIRTLKAELQQYKLPVNIINDYMLASKSRFVDAIDLYHSKLYKSSLYNIRKAADKLAEAFLINSGVLRPKPKWIIEDLVALTGFSSGFMDCYMECQGLRNIGSNEVEKCLLKLSDMIYLLNIHLKR